MSDDRRTSEVPTVPLVRDGESRTVRLPPSVDLEGVDRVQVTRQGDAIVLKPAQTGEAQPDWESFFDRPPPEGAETFLSERPDGVELDRFVLTDHDSTDGS